MHNRHTLTTAAALGSAALLIVGATGCAANNPGGSTGGDPSRNLEITSWWTSGSEAEALQVLIDAFEAKTVYQVENAAVSGGGGANARQALAARLQAGNPPDAWQLHPAGQIKDYVDGGQLGDITDLWEEGRWADRMPENVVEAQKVDGKFYTVPIGVHRGNVLWTNPSVLESASVRLDQEGSVDDLLASLQKVKDSGTTAVCLGDKDVFASAELLESIMMSRLGGENYTKLWTNEYPFDSPEVKQSLEDYATFLTLANQDHTALTWDEAAKNMGEGKCAVTLMGDWAYGELVNAGFEPETDFAWVNFPGKEDIFSYVGDGFSIAAKNVPNPDAAKRWLTVLVDPEVQADFAAAKGSIPAVTDADTSRLSEYQQQAAESFGSAAIVSSIAHAQASTGEITQVFADAVTAFNGNKNVNAFISSVSSALGQLG